MFPMPLGCARPPARLLWAALVAVCLGFWLLPLVGIALTSFKSLEEVQRGAIFSLPASFGFGNYRAVLADTRIVRFVLNSFLITLPAVAAAVALSSMAGFALAKYRLPGNLGRS